MTLREISAGAVIVRGRRPRIRYLLLHNVKGHWDFPKGKIERGEGPREACRREVREETGIRELRFVARFRMRRSWRFRGGGNFIHKTVWYSIARTDTRKIRLSREHSRGEWLSLGAALGRLGFANQRSLLLAADRRLRSGT